MTIIITDHRVIKFVEAAQKIVTKHYAGGPTDCVLTIKNGRKYAKIIATAYGQSHVYCFVNRENGDVLKAASFKTPAKHARGSIYADDFGASSVNAYGAHYIVR